MNGDGGACRTADSAQSTSFSDGIVRFPPSRLREASELSGNGGGRRTARRGCGRSTGVEEWRALAQPQERNRGEIGRPHDPCFSRADWVVDIVRWAGLHRVLFLSGRTTKKERKSDEAELVPARRTEKHGRESRRTQGGCPHRRRGQQLGRRRPTLLPGPRHR